MPASYKLFEISIIKYSDRRVQDLLRTVRSQNRLVEWTGKGERIHERKLIDEDDVFLAFQLEFAGTSFNENGFHVGVFEKVKGVPDGLLSTLAKEGKVSVEYLTTVY